MYLEGYKINSGRFKWFQERYEEGLCEEARYEEAWYEEVQYEEVLYKERYEDEW